MGRFILNPEPELIVSIDKRSHKLVEDKYDVHKVTLEIMELV